MTSFSELGLKEALLPALDALHFEIPTLVQAEVIPLAIQGDDDLIVVARTGTGKTASFGLPLLTLIAPSKTPKALILAPTRELANQIANDLRSFASGLSNMRVVTVYGGASIDRQIEQIKRGVSVVVATPGRLLDLANRRAINMSQVEVLVLDEADEMLKMGFKDELDAILSQLPKERRTWLFSATMARGVKEIAKDFMRSFRELRVAAQPKNQAGSGAESGVIQHVVYEVPPRRKYTALIRLIDASPDLYAIIFCRTRRDVQDLESRLRRDGIRVGALHGEMSQAMRDGVMASFKAKTLQLLVATDIAARGIDVEELTHVIHYDLPDSFESYTHRSGRTGRAGRSGESALLLEPRDRPRAQHMARTLKLFFPVKPLPTPEEALRVQGGRWLDRFLNSEVSPRASHALREVVDDALTRLTGEDRESLIERLCAHTLRSLLTAERSYSFTGSKGAPPPARRALQGQSRDSAQPVGAQSSQSAKIPKREPVMSRSQGPSLTDSKRERVQPQKDRFAQKQSTISTSTAWIIIEVNAGRVRGLSEETLLSQLIKGGLNPKRMRDLNINQDMSIFSVQEQSLDIALKSFKGFKLEGGRVSARQKFDEL
jgi:ATP-dependent RNA helicase DeaD